MPVSLPLYEAAYSGSPLNCQPSPINSLLNQLQPLPKGKDPVPKSSKYGAIAGYKQLPSSTIANAS